MKKLIQWELKLLNEVYDKNESIIYKIKDIKRNNPNNIMAHMFTKE